MVSVLAARSAHGSRDAEDSVTLSEARTTVAVSGRLEVANEKRERLYLPSEPLPTAGVVMVPTAGEVPSALAFTYPSSAEMLLNVTVVVPEVPLLTVTEVSLSVPTLLAASYALAMSEWLPLDT